MGCEVASPGELEQALRAGFEAENIVYDEPAKTRAVLEKVLELGIGLNIDNFQEFERVRTWLLQKSEPVAHRIPYQFPGRRRQYFSDEYGDGHLEVRYCA